MSRCRGIGCVFISAQGGSKHSLRMMADRGADLLLACIFHLAFFFLSELECIFNFLFFEIIVQFNHFLFPFPFIVQCSLLSNIGVS